jgi:hypothetical protein
MILKQLAGVLVGAFLLAGVIAGDAAAQRDVRAWVLLGQQSVGFGVDRDTIRISQPEEWFRTRAFSALNFSVRQNDVHLVAIRLVYLNGYGEDVRVDRLIRSGGSLVVDLPGERSYLRQIEMTYRSRPGFRGQALVQVSGMAVSPSRAIAIGPRPGSDWLVLGRQTVGFGVDRDVIRVGRREGRFEKILLEVGDNDVEILDLKVFYHRGPPQDVRVREFIRAGGRTRPLDLQGGDRVIERIELVYRSRPGFRGRATVAVYGLKGDGGRPEARWEELGCQKVGFGADRDVIRVGRSEGRFSAIRLRVDRSDVLLLSLRVVYERGPPDDFEVSTRIRAGEETRPLDLRGERRAIRQIDLVYSSIPSLRGSPTLCADGRQ